MGKQCRATHPDYEHQCDDEQGHEGPHYFKTYVDWWGCWGCNADIVWDIHDSGCEAVLEILDALELQEQPA